jgi:predicted nucleotidyltransferase
MDKLIKKHLKQKWERARIRRKEESSLRKKLLKEIAPHLFQKYGITRVILFGSAAENRSRPDSDIDLFVQPLPAELYWDFRRELEDMVEIPVDVYTDSDDKVFVKKIQERGEVIYEI